MFPIVNSWTRDEYNVSNYKLKFCHYYNSFCKSGNKQ